MGKSAVELEALAGVGDEVVGQEGGNVDRDFRSVLGANGLSAQLRDRFLQDARLGVEAHRRQQARLLGTKQLASAADLQIRGRHLEARTQLGETLKHGQALLASEFMR